MLLFVFYIGIFILSFCFTGLFRRFALANALLDDKPNARSAHRVPTPRGGGIIFVLCFSLGLFFMIHLGWVVDFTGWTLIAFGSMVAFTGLMDDYKNLTAGRRLLFHFLLSGLAIICLGIMPGLRIFSIELPTWLVATLGIFYLTWLLNLYNFMDGINGIATLEALSVCLSASLLYVLSGEFQLVLTPLLLAAAVSGFLYWNFPAARLFMGDCGSGFLGFMLGLFSLQAAMVQMTFFWAWLILLAVFIVDASVTLFRRALRGKNIFKAHASHAYQRAARQFNSHVSVSMTVLVINLGYLMPLAIFTGLAYIRPVYGIVLAYLPLVLLSVQYNAGKEEENNLSF